MKNILANFNRKDFRNWLIKNHSLETECWVKNLKRGEPKSDDVFYYIDAIEEALCFGWIDSVYKKVDGELYQKFSPRKKNSNWTVLNVARADRMIKLNLMTEAGLKVLPKDPFVFDEKVIKDIKNAGVYEEFLKYPELYQKIRVYNLSFTKKNTPAKYKSSFDNFVKMTKARKFTPGWDDYGRLSSK